MLETLRYRAYAGIVGAVLSIPWMYFEFLRGAKKLSGNLLYIYYPLLVIESALYIYFIWGFKIIGDKIKNKLLSISTIITLIFFLFLMFSSPFTSKLSTSVELIVGGITLVLVGVISIPFGIGLMRLKDKFGNLAKATGILNIITGVCFITVILIFIALLIYIPQTILEIILMFKAAQKL